jgi:signal transduction histidine kinase
MAVMEKRMLWSIRVISLCVMFVGLCLTILLSAWIHAAERRESEALFQQEAKERGDAIAAGIDHALHALDTIYNLFNTMDEVSWDQFSEFAAPILEKYPYILSLSYQRVMTGPRQDDYASTGRQHSGFALTAMSEGKRAPSLRESRYRVLDHATLYRGNAEFPGLDIASTPEIEEAFARSVSTGNSASTRLYQLAGDKGNYRAFTLLKPVFRRGLINKAASTAASSEILGYTAATFDASYLAYRILEQGGFLTDPSYSIHLYAGNTDTPGNRAFPSPLQAESESFDTSHVRSSVRTLDVAGREWTLVVSAPENIGRSAATASRATLLFGVILTGVLAAFLYHLLYRSSELKSAVDALEKDAALRAKAQGALRKSEAELRELAAHQLRVREDERKHMAREIHDDLGQNLLVLRMDLGAMAEALTDKCPDAKKRMEIVLAQIDATIKSTREIINHLRPSVLDLGAYDAIQWLMNHMNKLGKVHFALDCPDENVFQGMRDDDAVSLFRTVQEAMTNVIRHANATSSVVRVSHDGRQLRIEVSDNGSGTFPNEKRKSRSFGLIGIRERVVAMGGEFSIQPVAGQGTMAVITIPSVIPAAPEPAAA